MKGLCTATKVIITTLRIYVLTCVALSWPEAVHQICHFSAMVARGALAGSWKSSGDLKKQEAGYWGAHTK